MLEWLLYRRTSTVPQGENNTSMYTQDEECRKKAAELGYTNEPKYVLTEMESGAFMEREVLEEMLRIVTERLVSLVVILNPDRLARDPLHLLNIMRIFAESGVRLEFVHGSSDNSPEGQLLAFCTGWAAQRERTVFAQRSMLSRQAVAKSGRMPQGFGWGIYGYDYHALTKKMTVNEIEAQVVRMMYQWASEGVNAHAIAVRLNELQIPTKTGRKWSRQAVHRVLTNTAYYGLQYYARRRHRKIGPKKVERTDRPIEEAIPVWGFTPPIITKKLYDRVQEQLKNPQSRRGKKGGNQYLLTGFTRCGLCGSPVTGGMKARRTRYYRCTGANSRPERPAICSASYISEKVEGVVWNIVEDVIANPEILSRHIKQHVNAGDGNLEEEASKLRREIAANKQEQRQLIRLSGKTEIDQDILLGESASLRLLCGEKEQALRALEEQQRNKEAAAEADDRIREFCERISERLKNLDFDGKRAVLSALGVKVTVTKQNISITVVVDPSVTAMSPSSPCPSP